MGMAPLDCGPVLLRKPFGSRLAADTLPSGCPRGQDATVGASPWLSPSFPTSCPHRVRHGRVPQPTRHYPRLWIHRPSSERSRDFNPPDQDAAQHTLFDAPNPHHPSRRASLPSLGGIPVAPAVRSLGRRVRRPGPGVGHPVLPPGSAEKVEGPPRFLGDLRERALLSDPGGTTTPGHCGVVTRPSVVLTTSAPAI